MESQIRISLLTSVSLSILTCQELLLLFIKPVKYNVMTGHVDEGVVLVDQVQAVLDAGVDAEEMPRVHRDTLSCECAIAFHLSSAIVFSIAIFE